MESGFKLFNRLFKRRVIDPDMFLLRHSPFANQVFGILYYGYSEVGNNGFSSVCDTLELPWKKNEKNLSCIPDGVYPYEVVDSLAIRINNVSGRDRIFIHVANYWKQLRGCIAVGKGYKDINGDMDYDILRSTLTLKEITNKIPKKGYIKIESLKNNYGKI